jgi:hypothetical protein
VGKRGPAPQGEYENKSQVLSTRIRADTRRALVNAAQKSGRSLSQEIEHRLIRSFDEEQKLIDVFGDRRTFSVMRLLATSLAQLRNLDDWSAPDHWLDDPRAFDQATLCISKVLAAYRPQGPIPPAKDELTENLYKLQPGHAAVNAVLSLQYADIETPLDKLSGEDLEKRMIRKDLGEISMRPNVVVGTAKHFSEGRPIPYKPGWAEEVLPDALKEKLESVALDKLAVLLAEMPEEISDSLLSEIKMERSKGSFSARRWVQKISKRRMKGEER